MKLTETTKSIKSKNVARVWHLVDLKNKVLGRVASSITEKLQGKHYCQCIYHIHLIVILYYLY